MSSRFSVEAVFKAVDRLTAPVSRMQNRVMKFTRSMERGLRGANRAIDATVSGLGSLGKTAVKYAAVGLGSVAAAGGYLISQFSKIEDAEAAFTPLMGGATRARELVAALNDAAAATPFQFENLADTANQLLPVMNGNIEKTISTMRMLGDTAGGNTQKLDSITRGYTKAMLKGKTDMEALNMIAEAGVPIFTELAATLGKKTGPAFFKMISAGRVSTADLERTFQRMTAAGGLFYRGMDIASQTTSGVWSTLKDNISLTAAALGSVLAPTIKDIMRAAIDVAVRVRAWVDANRELINAKFLEFVKDAKDGIGTFVRRLREMNGEFSLLDRAKNIIVGVSDAFAWIRENGGAVARVTAAVVGLVVVLKTLTGVLTLVNLIMAANPITLIALAAVAAGAAVAALVVWIDDIVAGFERLPGVIRLAFAPLHLLLRGIKFAKDALDGGFSVAVDKLVGRETAPDSHLLGEGTIQRDPPAMVSPQDRVARSVSEQRTTSAAEVTIRDDTGRAEVTGGKLGPGLSLLRTGGL